jgi:hypothetical protein
MQIIKAFYIPGLSLTLHKQHAEPFFQIHQLVAIQKYDYFLPLVEDPELVAGRVQN